MSHTDDRTKRRVTLRIVIAALLIWASLGLSVTHGWTADLPTVALTASVAGPAPDAALADSLLTLTELELEATEGVRIVERRRLDRVLQELALQGAQQITEADRARVGKILTAELLVALRVEPTTAATDAGRRVRVQVVDARTAEILGLSVAPVSVDSLEDAARQVAADIVRAARRPREPRTSLAVAPLDSVGRFARLRPFELGVRDLLTVALLRRVGVVRDRAPDSHASSEDAPNVKTAAPAADEKQGEARGADQVQVLQRSDMSELLRELDLLQSGLVDRQQAPRNNPTRATSYLVRGTLDEAPGEGTWRMAVEVELWHADSGRRVDTHRFVCEPHELPRELDATAERVLRLVFQGRAPPAATPRSAERFEIGWLFERTLCDLQRFRRVSPIDGSVREFPLRPRRASDAPLPTIVADSPAGRILLRKSIDRLETILALGPEEPPAAASLRSRARLALGACRSMHVDEIGDVVAADRFLRQAAASEPGGNVASAALTWLAEIDFHHQTRQRLADGPSPGGLSADDPRSGEAAAERVWMAFEKMPEAARDVRWARLPELVELARNRDPQSAELTRHIDGALALAELEKTPHRYFQAMAATELLRRLIQHPGLSATQRDAWRERLITWTRSSDRFLIRVATFRLAELDERAGKKRDAARWFELGAAAQMDKGSPADRQARDALLVRAARAYREAGDVRDAVRVLESMPVPPAGRMTLERGYFGVELGRCYEMLSEPSKALAAYVAAAEECPGVVDNSPIVSLIENLGGVPLKDQRTIDVQYVAPAALVGEANDVQPPTNPSTPAGRFRSVATLATDGRRLFLTTIPRRGPARTQLAILDVTTRAWKYDEQPFGEIVALQWDGERLWIGTRGQGLWRGRPGENDWRHWTQADGLPDERVTCLVADGQGGAFCGVGDRASGGVVRVDRQGKVAIEQDAAAPRTAPAFLASFDGRIVASCGASLFERSIQDGTWKRCEPLEETRLGEVRVFAGLRGGWGSAYGRELFPWNSDERTRERFREAWFPEGRAKAGVRIEFVVERDGQVWFGGDGWDRFNSCGLYRLDVATGSCERFGPRDGFRAGANRATAGVWAGDALWVVVDGQLARVAPRGPLVEPK